MNLKQICGFAALALVMSIGAAHAADAPAAAAPAATAPAAADASKAATAPAAATEKCEVTKDGKATTSDVAVGTCEKSGGKVVAPAADAMKPADKK